MMTTTYFKSNSYLDGSKIKNVDITTSTIDMDGSPITSVADPTNPQDAATKAYVDNVGEVLIITLTATSYTTVTSKLKGSSYLIVEAIIADGPCATFFLSKSKSTKHAHITRHTSAPGDSVNKEQLDVQWLPGGGIQLKKTNINFDGTYIVKLY